MSSIETRKLSRALLLIGLAATVTASAVSLNATAPPQPMPAASLAPTPIESWTPGSSALVPLMATDAQATRISTVDEPASNTGGSGGKTTAVDDVTFVQKATESGRKEIAAARDALPQLQNAQLKSMAEVLVQDHTNANAKLSKLAEAKGWPVPGPTSPAPKSEAPPPVGAAAGDFDRKWTEEMIAGHERSVTLYRAQAQSGEDKDLRKYAQDTLPTIEHHLSELRKLQK
jgi:putative membrane protein